MPQQTSFGRICSVAIATCMLSLVPCLTVAMQDPTKPLKDMTEQEAGTWWVARVNSWKGERVILLPEKRPELFGGDPDYFGVRLVGQRQGYVKEKLYARRTGTITDVSEDAVVVTLDGGTDKVEVDAASKILGFFRELEAAQALKGTLVWHKGTAGKFGPADALSVTGASWGYLRGPSVELSLMTSTGIAETVGVDCIEPRLQVRNRRNFPAQEVCAKRWSLADSFLLKDPRKQHANWSAAIWKLILSGDVAIGMTEEMLDVACNYTVHIGYQITGNQTAAIRDCESKKKFLFRDGKVIAFVQ